ncbi:hypothetical protein GDO78_002840 [Eleutherodactylus coqui]|uniref:Uncharacterized protein n=1 Tax=Eleutherodactylus coqui TaxID=57060 RepID=A0A8J6EU41_ELECQ|nr:hypothetical protein GDO78_002840 [Eleutherodactylus coqui]
MQMESSKVPQNRVLVIRGHRYRLKTYFIMSLQGEKL